MKRLVLPLAVALFAATSTFANVEMDLNLYISPLTEYKMDDYFDTKVKLQYPIGLDTKWSFMIGAPAPFVDIGIKWNYALDFFWNLNTDVDGYKNDTDTLGVGFNTTLGPVVRFNLGDWHTIYVSPGLMAKVFVGSYETSGMSVSYDDDDDDYYYDNETSTELLLGVGLAFDLDIGYRIWLINRVGFHWGFDLGVDMNWPILAKGYFDGDKADVASGGEYKIYIGFAFNFGDKSPDKWR